MSQKKLAPKELVARVEKRLREDWGVGLWVIPFNRLTEEIRYSEHAKLDEVTVKVPSRSEFSMTLDEARAVRNALL